MRKARLASFLLLTMPGVPFVYYGEEIGMLGAKPDERLRTPMQWRGGHADGFTMGTPWEALQDDSLTTTVEAQKNDPTSVLAMNRRLIHLRSRMPALGAGRLVPLDASGGGVAAYVRRAGASMVLVVANLTSAAADGVTLSSQAGALPPGQYMLRSLLDGMSAARLTVSPDGGVRGYAPLASLAPLEGYVFDMKRVAR
jgi:glycosidase